MDVKEHFVNPEEQFVKICYEQITELTSIHTDVIFVVMDTDREESTTPNVMVMLFSCDLCI
jgi:hypothetical protein